MAIKKNSIGALALLSVFVMSGIVLAAGEIANWTSDNNGTVRINRTAAGANSIEADSFVGDVTGDLTGNVTATTVDATGDITTSAGDLVAQAGDVSATQTASGTVSVATFTAGENADAKLILDADDGDDNADTWTIESEATGNDLSVLNHTTEVLNLTSAGALQVDSTITATEGVIDGKYAVVGPDASTGLMILTEDVTAPNTALSTNTFSTVFLAAPVVTATYTEDPGDVRPIFVSSVTSNQVVFGITADKNYAYTAIGTRP